MRAVNRHTWGLRVQRLCRGQVSRHDVPILQVSKWSLERGSTCWDCRYPIGISCSQACGRPAVLGDGSLPTLTAWCPRSAGL